MTYKAQAPGKTTDQIGTKPKRFWKNASVLEVDGGTAIGLDGRPVKTPQGNVMVLPARGLAEAVAAEWAAVGEHVEFTDMPLTRLGFAAVDRMSEIEDATIAEVLRYTETDLLCFPSEYPAALQAREDAVWLPILAWADASLDLQFRQNKTVIHEAQPKQTLRRVQALIGNATVYEQAGVTQAMALFGSLILALALWKGHLTGEAAFAASRIGEDFQSETWGHDEEAAKRAEGMKAQALSLEQWFRLL